MSLLITKKDFIERFSDIYWAALEEIKSDDLNTGETSQFKNMGYVQLLDAFNYPTELSEAFSTYFDKDIFEEFLPNVNNHTYIINSTDKIEVSNGLGVRLSGRCFVFK